MSSYRIGTPQPTGKLCTGSLRQPWLVTDPVSGKYRGATIAETEAALADTDGDDDPRAMAADGRWTRADMPLRARFCRDQVDAGTSYVRDAGFMSSGTDVS
jgi:hypothetical protein